MIGSKIYQFCYVLSENKSLIQYKKICSLLNDLIAPSNLTTIIMDFEYAAIQAFKHVFKILI